MKAVELSSKICLSCCSPDRDKSKGFLACLERCMRAVAHLLAVFQVHASCCCTPSRRISDACELLLRTFSQALGACELLLHTFLQNFRCMRAAVAHLLAGFQVLMPWAHLQMALAEGSVQHNSRLNGQQIPQKIQALQQGTIVNQRRVRWAYPAPEAQCTGGICP